VFGWDVALAKTVVGCDFRKNNFGKAGLGWLKPVWLSCCVAFEEGLSCCGF
jgi:hypothetical protein